MPAKPLDNKAPVGADGWNMAALAGSGLMLLGAAVKITTGGGVVYYGALGWGLWTHIKAGIALGLLDDGPPR